MQAELRSLSSNGSVANLRLQSRRDRRNSLGGDSGQSRPGIGRDHGARVRAAVGRLGARLTLSVIYNQDHWCPDVARMSWANPMNNASPVSLCMSQRRSRKTWHQPRSRRSFISCENFRSNPPRGERGVSAGSRHSCSSFRRDSQSFQLASSYPEEGGIYAWTKREFGEGHAFLCGWCYWVNNML